MKTLHNTSCPVLALLFGLFFAGCAATGFQVVKTPNLFPMPDSPQESASPFICTYEKHHTSLSNPDADKLFEHASWLRKKNLMETRSPVLFAEAGRLYRIAAAWGNNLAAKELVLMLMQGYLASENAATEAVEISGMLIRRGSPQGYVLMGLMLENGYGVEKDKKAARQYFREAAKLGSPEAQYFVADHEEMRRCAAVQGHAEAAHHMAREDKPEEALKYLQIAAQAGSAQAANQLSKAFNGPSEDSSDDLGQTKDEERARRYAELSKVLKQHSYLNVTIDEIEQIVPLPPAKLPAWDGEIAQLKFDTPPPLPSEKRIQTMALAKGLEAETGLEAPLQLETQPPFSCAFEEVQIPKRNADADKLFKHAHGLHKKNLLKADKTVFLQVERLYRIAAAWGHDKAAVLLAGMMVEGHTAHDDFVTQPVELAEQLIQRSIAEGYMLMGHLLDKGHGVQKDSKTAIQHFRKAADLGNPEAQYFMGNKLTSLGPAHPALYKMGLEMKYCAAAQGHAEAAIEVADELKGRKEYAQAIQYLQMAARAGNSKAAYMLQNAFSGAPPNARLDDLGQTKDEERASRYKQIKKHLDENKRLNATVDEIDEIVPLPPAKLPAWDGQMMWLKNREKEDALPPLPEKHIEEMALKKGVDFKTGLPTKKNRR
ncbi:MAG: DUF6396 domain-containing protein [Cystobacterineae bacterium]|nr:DUF6396 domain-containing protein [Cystobacterineae bacterium]